MTLIVLAFAVDQSESTPRQIVPKMSFLIFFRLSLNSLTLTVFKAISGPAIPMNLYAACNVLVGSGTYIFRNLWTRVLVKDDVKDPDETIRQGRG